MRSKIFVISVVFFFITNLIFPIVLSNDSIVENNNIFVSSPFLINPCKILFIGSSYFNFNDLPGLFERLTLSAKKEVYIDHIGVNGIYLDDHASSASTEAKINEMDWDYVILQGVGNSMAYPNYFTDHPEYPALKTLLYKIKSNCESTKMVYCMPWAFEDGMTWYQNWTDTYADMQVKIYETTLNYSRDIGFMIAPVGWVWFAVLEEQGYPLHYLHMGDWNHPSLKGSYLMSCVLFSTLFQTSSVGLSHTTEILANEAIYFQTIASDIVLKNLSLWNIIEKQPLYVDDDNIVGPWNGSRDYPFQHIQDAVDSASYDDIIFVFNGTYLENIHINKTIQLIGQDRFATRIKGKNNENVITLASDSIFVSGFSLCNGSNGLEILSDFCEISNNNISQNRECGIKLLQSNYTKINGNDIMDNDRGISSYQSTNNRVYYNLFKRNNRALSLWYSSDDNILSYNTFLANHNDCISLYYSSNNLVTQNTFTNNNYSIFLFQSSNNNITNNTISFNNDIGILLEHSFNNFLCENTISENRNGIYLFYSYQNFIINNSIDVNRDVGIYCSTSLDNSSMAYDAIRSDTIQLPRYTNIYMTENNEILGNYLSNNSKGIVIEDTANITIQSNHVNHNNQNGVELVSAIDCVIERNIISNNHIGIKLIDSVDCLIHFQTFCYNNIHAFFINSTRINWDSNYWDNWLIPLPKPIIGFTKKTMFFPSIQFDHYPLRETISFFLL